MQIELTSISTAWGPYSPLQGAGGYNQWGESVPPHPDEGYGGAAWAQPPPDAMMHQPWLPPMTPRQPSLPPHMLATRDDYRQMPAMYDAPGGPPVSNGGSQAPPDVHRIPTFTPYSQAPSNLPRLGPFAPHPMQTNHQQQTPASFEAGLQALSLREISEGSRRFDQ